MDQTEINLLQKTFCSRLKDIYEQLIKVRYRDDLIKLIDDALSVLPTFSHCMLSLGNADRTSYAVFSARHSAEDDNSCVRKIKPVKSYFIADGFYDHILIAEVPVIYRPDEPAAYSQFPEYILKGDIKHIIALSLGFEGEKVGNLLFFFGKKDKIGSKLLDLITEIGRLVSLIIGNVIVNEEIRAREQEKSLLLCLSNDLSFVHTKAELSALISVKVNEFFESNTFVVDIINSQQVQLLTYAAGHEDPYLQEQGAFLNGRWRQFNPAIHNQVMDSGQPLCFTAKDLLAFPDGLYYLLLGAGNGSRHLMGISLMTAGQVFGVLWIYIDCYIPFSLTTGFANQIAGAIARIRSNEEIGRREAEKGLLLSFANELAEAKDKKQLSSVINRCLKNSFLVKEYMISIRNADGITHSFYLYDESAHFIKAPGFLDVFTAKMAIAGGPLEWVVREPEPVLFNMESTLATDAVNFQTAKFWLSVGIPQILGVKLSVGNENVGVLWAEPDQVDFELLKAVSNQIAIAISNVVANEKINEQIAEINRYKKQLEEENFYLQEEIVGAYQHTELVGDSLEMKKVHQLLSQVAFANSTVLILGETGTGKELVARAIHNNSPRKDKLMIKVNCATMPANLIESELFGHERGSFTGAFERRLGKFELANKGTLFLDEIGEMPLELQVKLLRALQEKEIERVGGKITIKVDVRIIVATNRDLALEVKEGRFRSDLFYRLNVFPVTLPPLRERKEDIPDLVSHFILKYAKNTGKKVLHISEKALHDLINYHWPGNVRELEHLIERSVLLSQTSTIRHIPLPITERLMSSSVSEDSTYIKTLQENERDHILDVLQFCKGKVFGPTGAAAWLGIPVSTLYGRMKKLGIEKETTFMKKDG